MTFPSEVGDHSGEHLLSSSGGSGSRKSGLPLIVSAIRFAIAPPRLFECGLLAWASCLLNGRLRIDGFAIRRTVDQRLVVSFPVRSDRAGRKHFSVRPVDDEARVEVEEQILRAFRHFAEEGVR